MANISADMLEKVMENAWKRTLFAIKNKGGNLVDIVLKNWLKWILKDQSK